MNNSSTLNPVRPKGKGTSKGSILITMAVFVGYLVFSSWVLMIGEKATWTFSNQKLLSKSPIANKNGISRSNLSYLELPVLRIATRLRLGEKIFKNRIELANALPILAKMINSDQYNQADEKILDLLNSEVLLEALTEEEDLVIKLQEKVNQLKSARLVLIDNIKVMNSTKKVIKALTQKANRLNKEFREFLKLPSDTDPPKLDWSNLYVTGPLKGLLVQPEIPDAPKDLIEVGVIVTSKISEHERRKITDAYFIENIKKLKADFYYAKSQLIENKGRLKKATTDFEIALNQIKKNKYLILSNLQFLVVKYTAPIKVVWEDLLIA